MRQPDSGARVRGVSTITTLDGTVIARDLRSGITASGQTPVEAIAELRRLLSGRKAA